MGLVKGAGIVGTLLYYSFFAPTWWLERKRNYGAVFFSLSLHWKFFLPYSWYYMLTRTQSSQIRYSFPNSPIYLWKAGGESYEEDTDTHMYTKEEEEEEENEERQNLLPSPPSEGFIFQNYPHCLLKLSHFIIYTQHLHQKSESKNMRMCHSG